MEGVLNKSLKKRSWRCMRISESYSNFLSLGSVHKLCNFEVNWMNQKDKKIFWRDFWIANFWRYMINGCSLTYTSQLKVKLNLQNYRKNSYSFTMFVTIATQLCFDCSHKWKLHLNLAAEFMLFGFTMRNLGRGKVSPWLSKNYECWMNLILEWIAHRKVVKKPFRMRLAWPVRWLKLNDLTLFHLLSRLIRYSFS